jgi:hypothetical protein
MDHFLAKRQAHLVNTVHASSLQASTVLITGIPKEAVSVRALTCIFGALPGGVKKVWINRFAYIIVTNSIYSMVFDRNLKELPDIYDRRLAACSKLEGAETAVLRIAAKLVSTPTTLSNDMNTSVAKLSQDSVIETRIAQKSPYTDTERLTLAEQIVPRDTRPSDRLPVVFIPFGLPCMGVKVDTIDWAREEIRICNELLTKARETIEREESNEPEPDADGKLVGTEVTYPALNNSCKPAKNSEDKARW